MVLTTTASLEPMPPAPPPFSQRVQALLKEMTVAEKAAQLDIFATKDMLSNGVINMSKAATNWGDLSRGAGVLHDVYPYPELANKMMVSIMNASRIKIPPIIGAEATHGLQMDDHTIFPSPIGLAATFDTELLQQYGSVVASEARAAGIHVTWAPVLGLCREPRWGRCEEMMGEDVYLASELGRASILGFTNGNNLTSSQAVAPLMKHYAAYSIPEGGHNTAPAHIGKRELLSDYVPPFAAGMEAGAQAMMVSYNEIDGEVNAASEFLLSSIPRNLYKGNGPKLPFEGYISADFGSVRNIAHKHYIAETDAEGIAKFITAGGSIQGFDYDHESWQAGVNHSIETHLLSATDLDLAVGRVLSVKERLGLFEQPLVQDVSTYRRLITSTKHEEVAVLAARKSMVLLQNAPDKAINGLHPVLPFNLSRIDSIALLGPNGDQPQCGDYAAGGSWGADRCGGGPINNLRTSSILGGVKQIAPQVSVTYEPGIPIADDNTSSAYFTTIQRHSFSTTDGNEGIFGTYFKSIDFTGAPAMVRNDYMLSFHFLNYGPDTQIMPASSFSARWEGFVTPDTTTDGALFALDGNGGMLNASLWLNDVLLFAPPKTRSSAVSLLKGQKYKLRFEYSQGDMTGKHPAFALQWSLQGSDAVSRAVRAVHENDVTIVVVGGGTSVTSGEGIDRSSMGLPGSQLEFLQAVRSAAIDSEKPFAVVVVQGKPFGEPWMKQSLPAILEAWQAGQAQGYVIAETLFGLNNPAGRTSVSFPVSADVLPVYYSRKPSASRGSYVNPPVIPGGLYPPSSGNDASVLWAFGHGLSYGAIFEYKDLLVTPERVRASDSVRIEFTITNTGTAAAEEVPQLYIRDLVASVTTPVMQLKGFSRTPPISPGATTHVVFNLDIARNLWLVNLTLHKVVEPGTFSIMVGGSSDHIQQNTTLVVVEN